MMRTRRAVKAVATTDQIIENFWITNMFAQAKQAKRQNEDLQ